LTNVKAYAEKKIRKLEKFLEGATDVQVVLSVIREEHIVEVTVGFDGLLLRGEESTGDMYASIDLVVEKLEKQALKYKTRLSKALRNKNRRLAEGKPAEQEQYPGEDEPKVVKTKRFPVKPMDVQEAILQMNLLGHDFFVFANSESNDAVNVLYRRKDGNYGLIDPDYFD